jgi:hypothetical protein
MSCTWTTIGIYYIKLQKHCSKIHSYEKVFFWQKGHAILFSNNLIGSLYPIRTHLHKKHIHRIVLTCEGIESHISKELCPLHHKLLPTPPTPQTPLQLSHILLLYIKISKPQRRNLLQRL